MTRPDSRVAIVTGAGNGLGRAYARYLAARGVRILVNNRVRPADLGGESSAERTVTEILEAGGEAVANFEDVAQAESGKKLVEHALGVWGRLDILINNAGAGQQLSFHKIHLDEYRAIFDVNFYGTLYVTHAAFAHMRQIGYGRIIMSSSAAGLYGLHGLSAYAAAKAALIGLMRTLAAEGLAHGIIVNAIAPYAATRMTAQHLTAEMQTTLLPELVAPMVAYLVSEQTRLHGQILIAGTGTFRRAAIIEGQGMHYQDAMRITPENIQNDVESIIDMTGAREYGDGRASFEDFFRATPLAL